MKRTELPRAEALCARYLDKNRPVLAAVSGGLDSMCLLHFLRGEGYDVSCAHFNHQLRGEEAARDEGFVRAWCEKEDIPFYLGTGDVRAHARATGKSEEEAARDLRYAFLRETAQMLGAQIALAHHADDNAETVLLNFVRGTDLRGLCGMRPKQGDIVRPFLEQTREELVTYEHPCMSNHTNGTRGHSHDRQNAPVSPMRALTCIPHVEDHTNAGRTPPHVPMRALTTADSMCLLYFLREQGYDVSCAHFNHQLRGEEAARDENFVRAWCEKEGIPFYPGTGDVRAHARATGKTEEEAGRDLRYAFLRKTAKSLGAQIALAHHLDDNAETVLLNLVRGADLRGLCGMRPRQGNIVRPFLEQTREELVAYARAHNIPHVEDHTNADSNAAARNYLRLEILPRLRELNPRAPQHIATTARSLTALDDALEQAAEAALSHAKAQDGGISLSLDCFLAADEVVQPRILLHLADALGLGRKDIGRKQLDAICALAQRGGSAERRYTLPQSATVRIADGALTMAFSPAALPKAALVENVPLPWGNFELTLLHKPDGEGISLRVPEDGEIITVAPCDLNARLMLQGANGARSVKRLCVDRKLSLTERDALPALYVGGRLAAVWRLGTDVTFLPKGGNMACFVRVIPR